MSCSSGSSDTIGHLSQRFKSCAFEPPALATPPGLFASGSGTFQSAPIPAQQDGGDSFEPLLDQLALQQVLTDLKGMSPSQPSEQPFAHFLHLPPHLRSPEIATASRSGHLRVKP